MPVHAVVSAAECGVGEHVALRNIHLIVTHHRSVLAHKVKECFSRDLALLRPEACVLEVHCHVQ